MKKNEKVSMNDILRVCISILKYNFSAHISNFLIWLLLSLLPLIFTLILRNLFTALENLKSYEYIKNLIMFTMIVFFNIFLVYKGGVFDTKSRFNAGKLIRLNLFSYFVNYDNYIDNSQILNSFNEDIDTIEEFISFSIDLINKVIFFIVSFIVLVKINYKVTIFVFIPLLLASFLIYSCGEKIKDYYNNAKKEDLDSAYLIGSIIKANSTIKYFNNGIVDVLEKNLDDRGKKNLAKNFFFGLIEKSTDLFNNISYVIIMVISYLFLDKLNGISNFTLFIEYISYGTAYLIIFQEVFINLKSIQKFLENLYGNLSLTKDELMLIIKNGAINERKNLNFPIDIRGSELRSQEIILVSDERLANEIKLNLLNDKKIAYVPKTLNLFDDSIENNITIFSEENKNQLKKVMEICCINEGEFAHLAKKEFIGKNGKKLSEGQRQRIAIARALYSCNEVLLLDNCFTNIDYNTSIKIIENLAKNKYTMIVLTQDLELFKNKDFIKRGCCIKAIL